MSRASITRARDAFAELAKELVAEELRAFVAHSIVAAAAFGALPTVRWGVGLAIGAAECAGPSFLALALVHLHDEAALRLRSHLDERLTQAPIRSRAARCSNACSRGASALPRARLH